MDGRRTCISKIPIITSKQEVRAFLGDLKGIIGSEAFDRAGSFVLISKSKPGADVVYSTKYTMLDLDYDESDVLSRLMELQVEEYSESLFDRDDSDPPVMHVFGKKINGKMVYIKLKIREMDKVICVSFHYAKDEMNFPYL